MTRVLIIDDERPIRESMARLLRAAGYEAVPCADGLSALERLRTESFDVVLTDLEMPGISGLELIPLLRDLAPEVPVVVLTAHHTTENSVAAMRHGGAVDFLAKPLRQPRELELTIAKSLAYAGRRIPPAALPVLVPPEALQPAEVSLAGVNLTPRERALLALLSQGRSNAEMAQHLSLAERTVRNYLVRLYQKMGVGSRMQAVMKLRELRVAPDEP